MTKQSPGRGRGDYLSKSVLTNIKGIAAKIERIIEEITSPCTPSRGGQ